MFTWGGVGVCVFLSVSVCVCVALGGVAAPIHYFLNDLLGLDSDNYVGSASLLQFL